MDDQSQQNPQAPQPQYQQNIIIVGKQKSVGVAFILAFFFGPLGLLYASVMGGIVMFFVGIVISIITLGFGLVFVWIGSIIWAVVAANNANSKATSGAGVHINVGTPPVQQSQPSQPTAHQQSMPEALPQPIVVQQPQPVIEPPKVANEIPQKEMVNQPNTASLNSFSDWVTNNKKGLIFALGGIIIVLVLVVAVKYVVSLDFSHNKHTAAAADSTKRADSVKAVPAAGPGPAGDIAVDSAKATANNSANNNSAYLKNGVFTGPWFQVSVPGGFNVKPSLQIAANPTAYGVYESAFFQSPDQEVEFYIFSGYYNAEASDITLDPNTEKQTSIKVEHTGVKEVTTWTEIRAIDNSYLRAFQDTRNEVTNVHKVVGLKYKSPSAYNRYKSKYLSFKKSYTELGGD